MQIGFFDLAFSLEPTSSLDQLGLIKEIQTPLPDPQLATKNHFPPQFPTTIIFPHLLRPACLASLKTNGCHPEYFSPMGTFQSDVLKITHLLIYLLKTFSICFCWNLPLITRWFYLDLSYSLLVWRFSSFPTTVGKLIKRNVQIILNKWSINIPGNQVTR